MSKGSADKDPKWSVGDDIGDGLRVVAVVTSVGARGLMCWCAPQWKPTGRAEYATFRLDDDIIYAARPADPFTVVAFHALCAKYHKIYTDPVVRHPWAVAVTGDEGFSLTTYYGKTRAETRQWVTDRPGVTVQAWIRSFTNDLRLHDDPAYFYVEDPAHPLCETSNDAGVTCMEPAAFRLEFVTGLVANVCGGCLEPIAAALTASQYTATPIVKEATA